jgi:hypothetical protein
VIVRETVWHEPGLGPRQVAVAYLTDDFEALVEATHQVGPFEALTDAVRHASQTCDDYLRVYGAQLALELGSPTPGPLGVSAS